MLRKRLVLVIAIGLIAIGLIAIATCSFAATVSYNTSTPIAYSTTDWVNALMFQQFNTALGTLTQVDLSITSAIQTTLTVENQADSDSSGNAKTHLTVTAIDPNSLLTLVPNIYSPAFNYILTPWQVATSGLLENNGTDFGSWTSTPILTEFTGSGNIGIGLLTFTETVTANTGGNTVSSQVTDANATGTVTYHYEVVPEPGSILVLSSALIGLLGFARKRKN